MPVRATMRRIVRAYGRKHRDQVVSDPGRTPAGPKKMHRVGLASVQLTRSTFAEATAGRESLQPRALRARCTRKPTARFGRRQAPVRDNVSQSARIVFLLGFAREIRSTQKHTEAVAPSSDLPTDRRRSDCLSEGHQPPALRPRCNRDTTARFMSRQVGTDRKSAVCEFFFTSSTILRLDACALTKRDQGFAEPGALSSTSPADLPLPRTASREGFVLVASRARRSGNLRLTRGPRKGICRRKPRNLRTRGVR